MPSERDFSLEGYRTLIEALLARGYMVRSFMDARPEKRHFVSWHTEVYLRDKGLGFDGSPL